MSIMIRKFDWPKWKLLDISNGIGVIPADLITKDLKTSSNTLSLWLADSDDRVEDVVLALVSNYTAFNIIDIIKIDREAIEGENLLLEQENATTRYSDYNDKHYNLTKLTYESLGCFSELILKNIMNVERIRVPKIKEILRNGIRDNKIKKDKLASHIQESLTRQDCD